MATTGTKIQKSFTDLKAALSAAAIANDAKTESQIAVRGADNKLQILTLGCLADGTVDAGDASVIQALLDGWKTDQDTFNTAKSAFNLANVTENHGNISKAMNEFSLTV